MKMTKRIFIALLIVSIMISVFAFTAMADEEIEVKDYSYLLEYFEEPTLIYKDYCDEELEALDSFLVNREKTLEALFVTDENAPGGGYLSLGIKSAENKLEAYSDNHVFLSWSGETPIDDFNIDMTVSGACGTGREQNLPRIVIAIGDEEYTDPSVGSASGTTLAALDYRRGAFYYLKATSAPDGTVYGVETETPFALTAGVWYDVSVTYDVKAGAATITVTESANPTNKYTVDDAYIPFGEVKNVRVGAYGEDYGSARGSIINISSVHALGGLYRRNPFNSQAEVEDILLEMYETFTSDAVVTEDRIAMCDVVIKALGHGFTTENADVQFILDRLGDGIVGFFNAEMAECIATYKDLPTYTEKKELINKCLVYVDELKGMSLEGLPEELASEVRKNINGINEANNYIFSVQDNCDWFILEVKNAKNCNFLDYSELDAYISTISIYPADPTYPGIEEYYSFYNRMLNSHNNIKTAATRFIELVGIAADTELDVNTRADAYRELEVSYFDNETYPGMTDALAVYHGEIVQTLGDEIEKADNFIKYVGKADYSIYISAKQENIDIASNYISCHPDYKGVAEAKLLYEQIQEFIDEQLKNAKAYISSVNALDVLIGDELLAAVEKAKSLQEKGNVLGVDGVTEANIKLDKIIASIELRDKYCVYFIDLVNSIDTAKSTEELYRILAEAKAAEADVDPSYDGVCDASTKLNEAIVDYNKSVASINSEFAKASETAANTSGVGKTANTVADRVIAFIKKLFGDD